MSVSSSPRPRLSLPFTLAPHGEFLHLIWGEDIRYSVRAGEHTDDLATLLRVCDGGLDLEMLLAQFSAERRDRLRELCARLYGERVLVDGPPEAVPHPARKYFAAAEGTGPLVPRLTRPIPSATPLAILCQDTLDYAAAMDFNRRRVRTADTPWMWVSTGPVGRGFVSPIFLPGVPPCLACLLSHFQRLSPAPDLYDVLLRHGVARGEFRPAPFLNEGLDILAAIAHWKVLELSSGTPNVAVYRLHVLELESLETSSHRVFFDPTCPECTDARLV